MPCFFPTAGFYSAAWTLFAITLFGIPLFAAADWAEALLKLEWRQHLTSQLMRTYFSGRAFYNLKLNADAIDNPDQVCWLYCVDSGDAAVAAVSLVSTNFEPVCGVQRICDDVAAFVDTSVFIVLSLMRKVFNCVAFASAFSRQPAHDATVAPRTAMRCALCRQNANGFRTIWAKADHFATRQVCFGRSRRDCCTSL